MSENETKEAEVQEAAAEEVQEQVAEATEASETTEEAKGPEVSGKLAEIIETIENLSVLELSELVKALEDKFGVTAAAPVAVAAGAVAGGDAGGAAEAKDSFDVILAEVGGNKIQVIKELRAVTELGLKEAKELVDSAPKPVKEGVSQDDANAIKEKLEAVGATIELK